LMGTPTVLRQGWQVDISGVKKLAGAQCSATTFPVSLGTVSLQSSS
jgi:hypothetical protein